MRSPALRHVIRLRLTLVGPVPEIWREVVVDRELSLADLRSIITTVFDGQNCRHHLYTDTLDSPVWSRSRRRWGDRLTMIDLRDPTIIDESTARIGRVLRDARPLYCGHTCEDGLLVEIEAFEDDLVEASAPPARVTGGERRAPLACCRGGYEHAVLVGVLEDPDHPQHEALLGRIQRTVGPWSHFDPDELDLADAQRRLDILDLGPRDVHAGQRPAHTGPLEWLVQRLPRAARAGLERHLAASGLDLPAVVTTEEARASTREFRWILARAAEGGIPLTGGNVDPDFVRAGAAALGCSEERMLRLVALSKRGRLVYARSGRLRANKRSAAAAQNPSDLWSLLARELVRAIAPPTSGDLLLLAIADGSLADSAIGMRRSAEALALLRHGHRQSMWNWEDRRFDDCDQACDCPRAGSGTWHDVVAQAIRNAAAEGANEGAVPVAAQFTGFEAREFGFVSDWFEDPAAGPYAVATRVDDDPPLDETAILRELDDLIHLLSMFGLERVDDGSWIVPPTLQEFARESLRRTSVDRAPAYAPF